MTKTLLCTLLLLFASTCVHTYCIYNYTEDTSYFMRQEPLNTGGDYFARFKRERLRPGENACCPYSAYDCNHLGTKEDMMIIAFRPYFAEVAEDYMFIVNLPAGGWLEFHGKSPNTEIKVFNADGSPFKFEYQKNPRSMLLN